MRGTSIEYRLLGPVEVVSGGNAIDLGGAEDRRLLSLLLLEMGRVLSVERLIEEIWGDDPPESANVALRVVVSRLRKALARAGAEGSIQTRSPGYVITVDPSQIDAARFELLFVRGRNELASGDAARAATTLRDALALWRGPALEGVASAHAVAEAARLEEARLAAIEERVRADLACGRHDDLLAELESLTSQYPLREKLWGARMLALYRAGRHDEALAEYRVLRDKLDKALGIEPSAEIATLYQQISAQDRTIDTPTQDAGSLPNEATALPTGVVTFFLTDIEGSSAAWEQHPEAMRRALERHEELISAFVEAGGGVQVKSKGEGDATLSVFRRATEAVATAFDLQMAFHAERWPEGVKLRVRVALHTGEAHERGGDYFGPSVNRAARLRALANGGHIVLSQATAELVRDHLPDGLELIDLGKHELKGLARHENAFELRSAGRSTPLEETFLDEDVALPMPPGISSLSNAPFVGREEELKQLEALRQEAATGKMRVVLLAGESGIGKTRLAAEVAHSAREDGAVVLFGRCEEDLGVPYQPFAEALRSYVMLRHPELLRRELGRAASDLTLLLPEITERLPGLSPVSRSEPEAERLRLFEAVTTTLSAISRNAVVLLVLDDLQWAAKPTLLMLRHLLRARDPMRVFVVGIYRDTDLARTHPLSEMLADLRKEVDAARILLSGLAKEDVAAFIETASGAGLDERGAELSAALYKETEGNPFFMTEVVRHLVDTGLVYLEDGRWTSRVASAAEFGLPEGVRDVISRRLSRLSEGANRSLAIAAVIGPIFSWRVVEAVPEAGGTAVLDSLEEAVRARLLVEESPHSYRFTHALIRQTLLAEISSAKKIRMHRHIAEAIESLPHAAEHIEALAFHFAEAAVDGQAIKAARYALLAARRAGERVAHEEAISLLERGLAALDLAEAPDPVLHAELLLASAELRRALSDLAGARAAALEAAELARRASSADHLARAAILITRQGALGLPDPLVGGLCEEALKSLDESKIALRACVMAGLARYRAWDESQGEAAQKLGRDAVNLAERSGDLDALSMVLGVVLFTFYGSDRLDELLHLSDQLLAVAERTADALSRCDGLAARALARLVSGNLAGFEEDAAELERYSTEERLLPKLGVAISLRVIHALIQGRFVDAESLSEHMMEVAGEDPNIPNLHLGHGIMLSQELGRQAIFLPRFKAFVDQLRPGLAHAFRGLMAVFSAQLDDREPAIQLLREMTQRDLADLPRDATSAAVVCFLTETAWRMSELDVLPMLHRALLPYAGQLIFVGRAFVWGAADRFLGIQCASFGKFDEAETYFKSALELEERVQAPALHAHTRAWYARMLIGRKGPRDADRARALLSASLATAEPLGMTFLAGEATALLAGINE